MQEFYQAFQTLVSIFGSFTWEPVGILQGQGVGQFHATIARHLTLRDVSVYQLCDITHTSILLNNHPENQAELTGINAYEAYIETRVISHQSAGTNLKAM